MDAVVMHRERLMMRNNEIRKESVNDMKKNCNRKAKKTGDHNHNINCTKVALQ